uniref:UDP-glucuronosyltransferase n=1 Tax=Poecilia formosa TaxID=48698 RepID=A0A096LRK1_POEFO
DVTNKIIEALGQLPQKVIRSYKGSKYLGVGTKFLLVNWMPQKDLLGHPKVKLFVAHGDKSSGHSEHCSHSIYRAKSRIFNVIQKFSYSLYSQLFSKICLKDRKQGHNFIMSMNNRNSRIFNIIQKFSYLSPTMLNKVHISTLQQCKLMTKKIKDHFSHFIERSCQYVSVLLCLARLYSQLFSKMKNVVKIAFCIIPIDMTSDSHIGKTAIVGKNTLLVNWMPQKDLLGHPKVKLFVAHGGTNGVQETIYHGVPIVGLPVFYDQYDNLLRLQDRGAAKILTLATVDKEDTFLKTVKEVLSEPSYRINMQRLSRLHRDQPMKPIDTALFWIEFAKHQGAAHLRTESHRL